MELVRFTAMLALMVFGCGGQSTAASAGGHPHHAPPPATSVGSPFGEKSFGEEIVLPAPSSGDAVPWASNAAETTCEAARKLEAGLISSGYTKLSWGTFEGGVLVETCLELIDKRGQPLEPGRRCHQPPPHPSSLADALIHFFVPREYAARVFVFAIAHDVHWDGSMTTTKTPGTVLHLSPVAPTRGSHCRPLPKDASLWRLVYQYRYRSDDSELELARGGDQPTPDGIIAQLTQSALLPVLEKMSRGQY